METEGKRLRNNIPETVLPEDLIQHIQSLLTVKEAARTTLLSKSWYSAWLTGPTLLLDQSPFVNTSNEPPKFKTGFAEFAAKRMQRYQDSNLKIDRLRLRTTVYKKGDELIANKLCVNAMKMGATDVNLEVRSDKFSVPREVLESETLVRLSLSRRKIDDGNLRCSRLKSLTLDRVVITNDDMFMGIVSCCVLLEELSLSHCRISATGSGGKGKMLSLGEMGEMNIYQLRKLRRLYLEFVDVCDLFMNHFESKFPCLNDLSFVHCFGYKCAEIDSPSLHCIRFLEVKAALMVELDIPNLVSFSYSGEGIPSICITCSRKFKSCISITNNRVGHDSGSWFLRLHKLFIGVQPSEISLAIDANKWPGMGNHVTEGDVKYPVKFPLVIENLTIRRTTSSSCMRLLLDLFSFFRPMFITYTWQKNDEFLDFLSKTRMAWMIAPDCAIPDTLVFQKFGLRKVEVQVYEESLQEWLPLVSTKQLQDYETRLNKAGNHSQNSTQMIRFQLMWNPSGPFETSFL